MSAYTSGRPSSSQNVPTMLCTSFIVKHLHTAYWTHNLVIVTFKPLTQELSLATHKATQKD